MNKTGPIRTRILSLLLIVVMFFTSLSACESAGIPSSTGGRTSAGKPTQTVDGEEALETEPDYSWFTFPEETSKLTVYSNEDNLKSVLDPAIRIFREKYPETEVDYRIYGQDEYNERIRAELPAGKGPDLLVLDEGTLPDLYKTMTTGIFEDLNPYFAEDGEIDLAEFLMPVMDGGVMNGKRYLTPLCYDTPLLVTTRSILDEIGMAESEIQTCDGFCEAARRFRELHPEGDLYIDTCQIMPHDANISIMYQNFGFNFIDYERNEAAIDEALFRQCMDLVKLYYDPDYNLNDFSKLELENRTYAIGGGLYLKTCLFDNVSLGLLGLDQKKTNLEGKGEEMILLAQTNQRDGITAELILSAAIPKEADNRLNAWRLLKILLSDEIQSGRDPDRFNLSYFWVGYPVRKASLATFLAHEDSLISFSDKDVGKFIDIVQSPTEALMLPRVYRKFLSEEILPYVRGERSWEDAYKRFLNTLELYKDE